MSFTLRLKDIILNETTIEDMAGVAHIHISDVTPYMKVRVHLARQLLRMLIINE